ncbi:MAG: TIGR00341 family protein [Capnocytophaga sp.]|nr:TIGR00341 family protein [Capnocytophaga sp.]
MQTNSHSKNILAQVKSFFSELINIHKDTDKEATVESIKADISLKGHTSWILICAIIIASLGLNANSTAVIIGAMLISPLMGPILGMALALAMNDVDLLKRAVKNFAVMVALSVASAFVFFYLFPLSNTSSELLARTAPDIRDVLIAFFGGLALVIARAKKGTMASVIFGVAIATALMPPLCTVGFFLSVGDFSLAFGALYLFLINTFFIALATFLVLRVIKIPMVKYANSSKRKLFSRLAYLFSMLMMIPAGYTFYGVWRESKFQSDAMRFIKHNVETYDFQGNGYFLKDLSKPNYNNGKPYIELVFFGNAAIPTEVRTLWNNQKNTFSYLKNAEIRILNDFKTKDQSGYITELYNTSKEQLATSQSEIKLLQNQLISLNKYTKEASKFQQIAKEIKANYSQITSVAFSNQLVSDFKKTDTIVNFQFQWTKETRHETKKKDLENLKKWLKVRLNIDTLQISEKE